MIRFIGSALAVVFGLWILSTMMGEGRKGSEQTSKQVTAPVKPLTEEERQALEKERLAKTESLQKQVKLVPASDYAENLRIYGELRALDPQNHIFQQKYAHFQKKQEEIWTMERFPERFVKISNFSWRKEGFGNVMEATLTLKSTLPFAVKDIKVKCVHFAPSGTEIDSNERTIYDVIRPGSTRTFHDFNMGFIHPQAERSGCQVIGVARLG